MRAPLRWALAMAAVQAAAIVLAHDLVYLARYGSRYGEALIHSGHGDAWRAASSTSLVLGGLIGAAAVVRLILLHVRLRRAPAFGAATRLDPRALLRTWLRVGPALAIGTVAMLTVQENIEQVALRGVSSGIGILLTPEYAGGLWIALGVGFLIGLVVALVAWRVATLEALLRDGHHRAAHRRPAHAPRPVNVVDRPTASLLGRRSALRAPPAVTPV